ncbi:hypothetical protein GCM10028799_02080 [Kribbella italica]
MPQRPLDADDSHETRDRVAGLLILLYGQTPARICRLTTAHIIQHREGATLQLNQTPLKLPPPLDRLALQLVDVAHDKASVVNASPHNAPWLFPTQPPGNPLGSTQLAQRLRLPAESARCAAMLDLCAQLPPAVIQRLLGVTTDAAQRWSSGAVRTTYAAEIARRSWPYSASEPKFLACKRSSSLRRCWLSGAQANCRLLQPVHRSDLLPVTS